MVKNIYLCSIAVYMTNLYNSFIMKKYIFFFSIFCILTSCSSKLNPEDAKQAVIDGERERIPLVIQTMSTMGVDDITIDSLVLLVKDEPMSGLLYTTWKSSKKNYYTSKNAVETMPIIIQVDSIISSPTQKGYVQWQSDWETAFRTYIAKRIFD